MKKIFVVATIVLLLFLTAVFLKNRKMDFDDIAFVRVDYKEVYYDETLIKEIMNYLEGLSKKKIQKKPEMDDATVLSISCENERRTENMQVKFTYLQKKIYLNIDENWYETELSLEDVWELKEKFIPQEKD